MGLRLIAISICLAANANAWATECASQSCPPSFQDYPAPSTTRAVLHVPLVLSTTLARQYRTVITQQASEAADFADHYKVATWGCGTDCRGFAIINQRDGRVYTMPGLEYVAGVAGNAEDRLAYRLDSRLFVITGRKNDEDEGKFYYRWNGNALKLILRTEITKESFED